MAQTYIRLSLIIRDPAGRTAFERAERDSGDMFAVPANPESVLPSGDQAELEAA